MIRAIVVVVAALAACDPSSSEEDIVKQAAAALDQIASGEAADRANLLKLRVSAADLARQVRQVAQAWWTIAAEFDAATEAYDRAHAEADEARAGFDEARIRYQQAADRFRTAAVIIIAAAASDALRDFCRQRMSTRMFRTRLRAEGISIEGKDVDHAWPRALGGADHPLNYQLLDSSVNRSLGADPIAKLAHAPLATLRGLTTSALVALGCD